MFFFHHRNFYTLIHPSLSLFSIYYFFHINIISKWRTFSSLYFHFSCKLVFFVRHSSFQPWLIIRDVPFVFCHSRGNSLRRVKNGAKWRVKEISLEGKPPEIPSSNRQSASLTTNEMNPTLLAQANWTFVEKLLKVRYFTTIIVLWLCFFFN